MTTLADHGCRWQVVGHVEVGGLIEWMKKKVGGGSKKNSSTNGSSAVGEWPGVDRLKCGVRAVMGTGDGGWV